jgi:uncharacterized protein
MTRINLSKYLLIAAGWLFIGLGIVGAFLPLLPSTIFFIIAAWCFSKSSERFHKWLMYHPIWGKQLRFFFENRGMPLVAKIIAILTIFISIFSSIYFFARHPLLIFLLLSVAFGVSAYIISLKTIRAANSQKE